MAASNKVNTAASDGGLASCMQLARVEDSWLQAVKDKRQIETLDDFVAWQSESAFEDTLQTVLNECVLT